MQTLTEEAYASPLFMHICAKDENKYILFYRLQSLCFTRYRMGLKLHHAAGATKEHPPKTSITLSLVNRKSAVLALCFSSSSRASTKPPSHSVWHYNIFYITCQIDHRADGHL